MIDSRYTSCHFIYYYFSFYVPNPDKIEKKITIDFKFERFSLQTAVLEIIDDGDISSEMSQTISKDDDNEHRAKREKSFLNYSGS